MTTGLPPAPQHFTRLKALLARIRHFDGIPPEVQERIAASASPRHFAAGQVIYIEGEPAEALYLLERGWVKATRMSRDGREQAMLFLESGEIFGDIAVFSGTTYPGTVVALEDVDVWTIPADNFLELTKQYPALAMAVIRHLSGRVLHYISLVEDLSLRNVEARLANTLLQHAEAREGQLIVPRRDWTTFDEMAVRLGTVRDVLSRGLKTLEADGLLKVEKQAIVLLDPKGLAERGKL
ncbi:MAG: Crp/Fnr family transcriptional regulator [Chloroflexota bacterium]